jgi:hypothetical protein
LASEALAKKKLKIRKAAEESLCEAQNIVTKAENKASRDLKDQGIVDYKAEKERLKWIKD